MAKQVKRTIAQQLSQITGHTERQLLELIEKPKSKQTHFSLSVPLIWRSATSRLKPDATLDATNSDPKSTLSEKLDTVSATGSSSPLEYANELARRFVPDKLVTSANVDEHDHLNFSVNGPEYCRQTLGQIFAERSRYGTIPNYGKGRLVGIDYSSPNMAKPMHSGHMRGTILGGFFRIIHEAFGYKVIGINYLGDWGKQYGLLAVGYERMGSEALLKESPVDHLYDIYVKINAAADKDPSIHAAARQYFKRMEDGEEASLSLWKRFRTLSIQELETMYERIGVRHEVVSGESTTTTTIPKVLDILESKKLIPMKNGEARLVNLEKYKLPDAMVQKEDGTTLYLTRDLAAALNRWEEFKFDRMLYVVGFEQTVHMRQFIKTAQLMFGSEKSPDTENVATKASKKEFAEDDADNSKPPTDTTWPDHLRHLSFGRIKGFSSRKGNAVLLRDILDSAKSCMRTKMGQDEEWLASLEGFGLPAHDEIIEGLVTEEKCSPPLDATEKEWISGDAAIDKMSDILGLSAIMLEDLKTNRASSYNFDLERMTDPKGDTGVLLQYTHVRLCGIERNCGIELNPNPDFSLLHQPEILSLVIALSDHPNAVLHSLQTYESAPLVRSLLKIAKAANSANRHVRVKGVERKLAEARLLLIWATRITLGNGLRMLGIRPLLRM